MNRIWTEEYFKQVSADYFNQFIFDLVSEYADEVNKARFREIEAKNKVIELNEILKIINKILRHDILNDITVIGSNIDLYLIKKNIGFIDNIKIALNRSLVKIHKMGELESAISSGKNLKTYKIEEIAKTIAKSFPHIKFSITGKGEVMADEALHSVVENILRNADIHASAKKVSIHIKEDRRHILLSISDYGKGIPDTVKKKLFQENYKYGETGQTGLGLYIVRKTMERYKGKVIVKDNKPQGSTFDLLFPKAFQVN